MRNQPVKRDFARRLRKDQTDSEAKLWKLLRSKQLENFKFRRQHIIGPYIADFCCLSAKLIIELDGAQHAERVPYDEARTYYLENQGYKVLRFWDNEVLLHPETAAETVLRALTPTLSQLKLGEGAKEAS
jgi:very-short-patch-repair endonuclease